MNSINSFAEVRTTKKKSALVARQILDAFESRRFEPGDKLPPERVLAQDMKVSRTCVREALKALEVLGLIESRVGDGTYVLPDAMESTQWLPRIPSVHSSTDLVDIWEARAEIEAVVVRLAIHTATSKTIARIESLLKKMHQMADEGDAEGYLDQDRQFHMAIARGADNPLFESIINPLIQLITKSLLEDIPRTRVARRLKVSVAEHEELVSAIKRRDEDAAVEIVRDHFKKVRDFYGSRLW
ncbi:FadR/GntR family transcriptional regulator [Candidatus Bipolaricaulota bacterium]